jgi:accessory colonization factor AcfC
MTVCRRSIFAAALGTILAFPAVAHEVADPTIKRTPRDGTVRLYGAGGPDTAFKKVAAVFTAETGIKIEVTGGPEPTWSRKAQADADVSWGAAEEDITALLETYTNFAWVDVTPIYIRPAIIPIRKGNPKHISGFEDLLKPGMRLVVTEGAGVANTSGTGVWEDVAALEFRV